VTLEPIGCDLLDSQYIWSMTSIVVKSNLEQVLDEAHCSSD
jgi:hypothetical protein